MRTRKGERKDAYLKNVGMGYTPGSRIRINKAQLEATRVDADRPTIKDIDAQLSYILAKCVF